MCRPFPFLWEGLYSYRGVWNKKWQVQLWQLFRCRHSTSPFQRSTQLAICLWRTFDVEVHQSLTDWQFATLFTEQKCRDTFYINLKKSVVITWFVHQRALSYFFLICKMSWSQYSPILSSNYYYSHWYYLSLSTNSSLWLQINFKGEKISLKKFYIQWL